MHGKFRERKNRGRERERVQNHDSFLSSDFSRIGVLEKEGLIRE